MLFRGLVGHGGHGFVFVFFTVEANNLRGEGGLSWTAGGATFGHDHAAFVQRGRVNIRHFEQFRCQTVLPEDRLAAMVAFHIQEFGIEFSDHALSVNIPPHNDKGGRIIMEKN